MALIEINRNPSKKELGWFGLLFALFFGIVGGLVWWKWGASTVATWIWSVAGAIAVCYYAIPPFRMPLYIGWVTAAFPIGWLVSHVVLAIVYYLVVTPIGVAVRMAGRIAIRAPFDPQAKTYWVERPSRRAPSRYFRQF